MSQKRPQTNWIGHVISGRYKIESVLGQGGMSSVYKAIDPNLQRTVAVKLIHPHLSSDQQFVRRFEQEAAAVAQLRHPNIIQVYDFNHDDDLYYMVLEYVEGETLQQRLKTLNEAKKIMPIDEVTHIMATVADAVNYAHGQNMIHRDLKPANVMLNQKNEPILMDFGVAKMLGAAQHTATGAIIGTAKYMSPEQARGDRPDARTDIYSLGVMLYEMVTGDPPFDADSTVAILMKHVSEPLPDVRQINKNVPDELVAVIQKALAKDRANRYQTAGEMAAALRAIASPQTIVGDSAEATILQTSSPSLATEIAPPSTTAEKSGKQGGLPMWAIGLGAGALLLLLSVGAFFIFSGDSGSTDADGQGQAIAAANGQQSLPSSERMTRIPAGTYTVGVDVAGDTYAPSQQVSLDEYWIDQYEVTNSQYAQFVSSTEYGPPSDWPNGQMPAEEENHPVDGVSWESAAAYCRWAGKRLPSEAEWEVAARGSEGRLFPWGNNQSVVPLPQSGTYAVGSKPTNQSPFGVFDMAGNVWEWVDEPYAPLATEGYQVLRGGANGFLQNMAYRLQGDPNIPTMMATAGFRCAAGEVEAQQVDAVAEDVLFSDTFGDPGSGWPILTEGNFLYGYHPPDFYHVQVSTTDDHTVVTRDPALTDFTAETNVQVFSAATESGNFRYGLAFRRAGDEQYYAFAVSPRAGTWHVLKSSPAGLETLSEGKIESLRGIAPQGFSPGADQIDTLRVDGKGNSFIFYINNEPLAQLTDADYSSGEIGFFVENFDETLSHIHYDDFTIREVEFDEALAASLAPAEASDEAEAAAPATEEAAPTEEVAAASDTLPTAAPTQEAVSTTEPAEEPTAEPTEEPTTAATEEPSAQVASANREDMVLIDPNFFNLGSNTGQPNEAPEHPVLLDGYYIDKYEVTNAQYRQCVADGGCTPSGAQNSFTYSNYRDDPQYDNYPVVSVNWDQANAYCQWAGKRLPTEAEWEFAASGPLELTWPWGNTFDPAKSAASAPDTQPVDSYPEGVSPFGVYNMAGNVNEWVADTFDEAFYANSPAYNPVNNRPGAGRIFRGGSFDNPQGEFFTTTRRYGNTRSFAEVDVGFRCAADADLPASNAQIAEFCALYATYKPGAACP